MHTQVQLFACAYASAIVFACAYASAVVFACACASVFGCEWAIYCVCLILCTMTAGAEAAISMKRLIAHLRKQRIGMVQTVQQYVFIYQALYDEITEAFEYPGQSIESLYRASGSGSSHS